MKNKKIHKSIKTKNEANVMLKHVPVYTICIPNNTSIKFIKTCIDYFYPKKPRNAKS